MQITRRPALQIRRGGVIIAGQVEGEDVQLFRSQRFFDIPAEG